MSVTSDIEVSGDSRPAYAANCSVRRALESLGPHSALLLLREAFYGTRRFDDFVERVGISEQVAAARLKALVQEGLLEREPYQDPGQRTRQAYRLTTKGKDLHVALIALMQWGDRYNPAPGGPSVVLSHRDCGAPVVAEIRCTAGHHLQPRDMAAAPGPGATAR